MEILMHKDLEPIVFCENKNTRIIIGIENTSKCQVIKHKTLYHLLKTLIWDTGTSLETMLKIKKDLQMIIAMLDKNIEREQSDIRAKDLANKYGYTYSKSLQNEDIN